MEGAALINNQVGKIADPENSELYDNQQVLKTKCQKIFEQFTQIEKENSHSRRIETLISNG